MVFRLPMTIELERADTEFSRRHEVPLRLVYERGRWRAECQEPPIATFLCESMEEALTAAAHEISVDLARQESEKEAEQEAEALTRDHLL